MEKYKQKISRVLTTILYFAFVLIPAISFADCTTDNQGSIINPLGNCNTSISDIVSQLMVYVVRIGGIIAIFAFVYSGYLFVKARGNEKELGEAKTVFVNTVIGVAILLGAQLIASIIVNTIKTL